ncbi:MAG: TRAM domain-containing protein, partial [Clostridia bacterium]|nr:TRAM domain-containing protein [Clostridia bacterium]
MEIEIFDYGMNGEGVGKINGKIALINNALVGEVVGAEIVKENKNFCMAKVNNIL